MRRVAILVGGLVLAQLRLAAADRPRVEIPAADSTSGYATTRASVPRSEPDDWGVRAMWRGRLSSTEQSVLVMWLDSNAQTMADPVVAKAAEQLFERSRPGLAHRPEIEVVVIKPFFSRLPEYTLRIVGAVWIRDSRNPCGWRRPGHSERDREMILALIRNLS